MALARKQGLLRASDVAALGWSPQWLIRLYRDGQLQRVARGLYALPERLPTERQTLAEVCHRVPKAVVCLLSALQFHGVGTALPHEVWVALPSGTSTPTIDYPPLRVSRVEAAAYAEGMLLVPDEGVPIRVYGLAKTIADCFKFRGKVGIDTALEALKDAWHARLVTMDELVHHARVDRVERVMRPYLEMLVA